MVQLNVKNLESDVYIIKMESKGNSYPGKELLNLIR